MEKEKHLKWPFHSRKQFLFKFKTSQLSRECTLKLCGHFRRQSVVAHQKSSHSYITSILLTKSCLRGFGLIWSKFLKMIIKRLESVDLAVLHWPTHAFANGSLRRSAGGKPSYRISHMVSRHGRTDIEACRAIL